MGLQDETVRYNLIFCLIIVMSSIRDFVPLSKLGEGTYSTVYKVRRISDQQIYALKKVKMNQLSTKEKENALNEVRILASIDSPSIVSYKQAFFDEAINVLCVIMEYADGGDLQQIIAEAKKKNIVIEEKEIWSATKNMLMGLDNLHSRGIMHRDLKSANVFKSANGYKLGDLNVSKVVSGSLAYTQTGTPYYASPEVWRDEPYDAKSDIWSLGCIVYEMACQRPPYQGKTMEDLFKNIQNKGISCIPSHYSRQLWEFIQICLNKKAAKRLSARQFLTFPYFQKYFKDSEIEKVAPIQSQYSRQNIRNKEGLLQTIKLPSDLSKLKQKLPNSKYQTEKRNKSQIIETVAVEQRSYRTPNKVQGRKINKSEVFKSPPPRANLQQSLKIARSPVTDVKLSARVQEVIAKYSDRLHLSDKKSNKVERAIPVSLLREEKSQIIDEKYLRQQISKRPSQNSIPRTEKAYARERIAQPILTPINSQSHIRNDIEQIRRKLVKKTRVMSSNNNARPFWWG